jgi:hypothetical protein
MKKIPLLIILFLSVKTQSQPDRSEIIEKKIKSLTKTFILNDDTVKKEIHRFVYRTTGDDSIQFVNDNPEFKFIAENDEKGRVSQLIRYDAKGRPDEWHKYSYNRDGSYTIEIIAHGAGTISLAKYNKKHWLMEEEIESSYSLIYQRNASGRTQKILLKEKNKSSTEEIAVFYFDKNGFAINGEGTTEGGNTVYFKYNDRGLTSEIKTVFGDKKTNQTTETVLLEYEFYEN